MEMERSRFAGYRRIVACGRHITLTSFRDVEDLLAERGLDVSYETVGRWVLRFGSLLEASEVANVVTFVPTRPRSMTIGEVVICRADFAPHAVPPEFKVSADANIEAEAFHL